METNNMIDLLEVAIDAEEIFNYFGAKNQRLKLIEESPEFMESLKDEEIADLFCLTLQFFICQENVRQIVFQKIERTKSRIEEGYYVV